MLSPSEGPDVPIGHSLHELISISSWKKPWAQGSHADDILPLYFPTSHDEQELVVPPPAPTTLNLPSEHSLQELLFVRLIFPAPQPEHVVDALNLL